MRIKDVGSTQAIGGNVEKLIGWQSSPSFPGSIPVVPEGFEKLVVEETSPVSAVETAETLAEVSGHPVMLALPATFKFAGIDLLRKVKQNITGFGSRKTFKTYWTDAKGIVLPTAIVQERLRNVKGPLQKEVVDPEDEKVLVDGDFCFSDAEIFYQKEKSESIAHVRTWISSDEEDSPDVKLPGSYLARKFFHTRAQTKPRGHSEVEIFQKDAEFTARREAEKKELSHLALRGIKKIHAGKVEQKLHESAPMPAKTLTLVERLKLAKGKKVQEKKSLSPEVCEKISEAEEKISKLKSRISERAKMLKEMIPGTLIEFRGRLEFSEKAIETLREENREMRLDVKWLEDEISDLKNSRV